MNEWPIAINTYSYIWKYDAHETLNRLADKGYRQFEFLISPPHCWPESLTQADRARVSALLASRDLKILVLNPPSLDLNLVSAAGEMRRYTVDHYLRVIDLAADWNVPYVLVVPGKTHPLLAPPKERVWSWFLSAIEELERHAERVGVRLILENVPASFLPKADDLMRAIERLGIERVGIAYDVANAVFVREAPVDGLRIAAKKVRIIHLSDTGTEKWAHSRIGDGVVPFAAIANAIRELALTAPSVLEIISDNADEAIAASHLALNRYGWRRDA